MNRTDNFISAALATGLVLFGAEIWRLTRERDAARQEFEQLVSRMAAKPETVFSPAPPPSTPIEPFPYISDLPYHDDFFNEFVGANEALDEPEAE